VLTRPLELTRGITFKITPVSRKRMMLTIGAFGSSMAEVCYVDTAPRRQQRARRQAHRAHPQVIRDPRDARDVAEELRSRLHSMATPPPRPHEWRTHSNSAR